MKFDMTANEIATKEHRTMISQFSPSMISKTHNIMKQNTANVLPFQSTNCSFYFKSKICYLHVNSWINKYIYQYINFTQVLIVTYMKIWIYKM